MTGQETPCGRCRRLMSTRRAWMLDRSWTSLWEHQISTAFGYEFHEPLYHHCTVLSSLWFSCTVEFYLVLDAADGIKDMIWIGCFPKNKFILLGTLSTLPIRWCEWIFSSVFLLANSVGLRNLKFCHY